MLLMKLCYVRDTHHCDFPSYVFSVRCEAKFCHPPQKKKKKKKENIMFTITLTEMTVFFCTANIKLHYLFMYISNIHAIVHYWMLNDNFCFCFCFFFINRDTIKSILEWTTGFLSFLYQNIAKFSSLKDRYFSSHMFVIWLNKILFHVYFHVHSPYCYSMNCVS